MTTPKSKVPKAPVYPDLSNWVYYEPFAGSAAIANALIGTQNPVPYQGHKWKYRKPILARFASLGFADAPRSMSLTDAGPWGITNKALFDPHHLSEVYGMLSGLLEAGMDPRELFDGLHQKEGSPHASVAALEHLVLQRLAFSGKAVSQVEGRWNSPGFNKTSAYGVPARTDGEGNQVFGKVKPMLPSLLRQLEARLAPLVHYLQNGGIVTTARRRAHAPTNVGAFRAPTLVYLDPPYAGTTQYTDTCSRDEVLGLVEAFTARGAVVVVSEAEPLNSLADFGVAGSEQLAGPKADNAPFRSKRPEYLSWVDPRRTS